ncbi:SAM-dependent methyltransferase [uncultured Sphaerochaeta sp.]|uniref:TRM11 family SAM-dependent methyltransferase n=1 Tax=uncultured Sphaerochaeta sp. TaxID=886478 RepID=UPI002A0A29CA|nr:SAM-dependent methyltransferase [uncultured Sphaerochaeta sp.]
MGNTFEQNYFYVINYPEQERELCLLEMKSLFNKDLTKKYFFSSRNIDPSRSPFIKLRISLLYTASSLQELVQILSNEKITVNNFKFARFRIEEGKLDYATWIQSVTELGKVIQGEVDMKNPTIQFGTTLIDGLWIFGIYEKNENPWEKHNLKPYTNSNSLETRTARAIVNIAVGQQGQTRLVDPCCGVGTVVLEALSLAIPVIGYEINWIIAKQAEQNISYFGYDSCIVNGDMQKITERYDVAIIDLPYGLFTPVTHKQQMDIINSSRRITQKLVMITGMDMDKDIISAGFTIVDRCTVNKGSFVRFVRICY